MPARASVQLLRESRLACNLIPIRAVRVSGAERDGTSGRVHGAIAGVSSPRSRGRPCKQQGGQAMDTYEVELEAAEPEGFAVTVPALPGLLVLGATIDEVLSRA